MTKSLFPLLAAVLLLAGCHKDKNEHSKQPATQSVLVYIAGDNNLQDFIRNDIAQMKTGSKELAKDCNLLLFVDRKGKLPYFLKMENGDTVRVETLKEEVKSSDTETLKMAMNWMTSRYEAKNYGLILWGHADGWLIWKARQAGGRPRQAYGQDTTGGETWMNIPDMARALATLPHLRFIFADCCCFQSVESAYELRNVTDYIIASAAEIPGEGAPYQTVIPALFSQRDDFYKLAADAYYNQVSYSYREPMAVVKTSEMENLAQATKTVLKQCHVNLESDGYPNVDRLIYYYDHSLFDMQHFLLTHAPEDAYAQWKRVFDTAVPYRTMTEVWMANHVDFLDYAETMFRDFEVTEENYGGVSMFVPQNRSLSFYREQNERIKEMQWYTAAGLHELGW